MPTTNCTTTLYRCDEIIIMQESPDKKTVTGSTRCIETDVIAGWCGVDMRVPVKFTWKRGTLHLFIGDPSFGPVREYAAGVYKRDLAAAIRKFLSYPPAKRSPFFVKEVPE